MWPFKSPQKKVAIMVAKMYGVDPKGMEMQTEVEEWMQDLPTDDARRAKIPEDILYGDFYLVSVNREQGYVFRITEDELEIRLPYKVMLNTGVEVPHSHMFRALPNRALLALGEQRAQKVIRNLVQDATETFRDHQRMCYDCFKLQPPPKYPGNPEVGILGPPAEQYVRCKPCTAKARAKEAKKAEEAANAAQ